jgi:hypothetical protein
MNCRDEINEKTRMRRLASRPTRRDAKKRNAESVPGPRTYLVRIIRFLEDCSVLFVSHRKAQMHA